MRRKWERTLKKRRPAAAKTDTQVSVRITSEFKGRLEQQAQKERRSVANLILKVMEEYLDAQEEQKQAAPMNGAACSRRARLSAGKKLAAAGRRVYNDKKGGFRMPNYDSLVSFRAPSAFKQELERQARKERMSVSALVLRVMREYLEQVREQK